MSGWSILVSLSLAQAPAAPTPDELMKKLDATPQLKDRDKPFEISASLARLYFSQGRTTDAAAYAREALERAAPVMTFFTAQKKALGKGARPSVADAKCSPLGADASLAAAFTVAQQYAAARKPGPAVVCARVALTLVPDVMLLEGHAKFLKRDFAAARASYEAVLATFDDVPEARYARAALTIDESPDDVKALSLAQADFERFLSEAPNSPSAKNARALLERTKAGIAAQGLSRLAPEPIAAAPPVGPPGMPVLDQATIAAFQNAPRTDEGEARFAKLIEDAEQALATGQYQQALDGFKQVMPYQPENTRLRAGMAWSLVKLGKPMADNVWRVAAQAPEAVDQLGDRLKAKGDAEGAKALWTRLAETAPGYAPKLEGKR